MKSVDIVCEICGKRPQVALNRPHSLHKTKKLVRPNLGPWNGLLICAQCRKSLAKPGRTPRLRRPAVATEAQATAEVKAAA